ncbi:MAG TPA: response regulator [Candidatus Paceibacterota bacterium]|jgi:DNA-binding response OmpR family regulator|nr:response regulator [Candidatus Paceibacterota bacterium]
MSTNSTKKEKILIIEGDTALGTQLSNSLKAEGYVVFLIKDGTEGLKAIYDTLPQLVIIDLIITGTDAYDILAKKNAEVMLSKIPVFILSTQGEPINMRKVPENSVTDFIVSLHADPADLVNRVNKYFGHANSTDQVTPTIVPGSGKKVLWVEDDKLIGSILAKKFISSGFNLFHAQNGEETLAYLKDNVPDIVVLDLMLPGMDGFEILQKIRMDERTKSTPAMILSNLSKPSDLEKAKMLGASKFMVKASSSLDQIVAEVKKLAQ